MNRRDFLENTALGAVLAPILAIFGVEPDDSSENGGNWDDFARNHPDPPVKPGSIRVLGEKNGRVVVEVAVLAGMSGVVKPDRPIGELPRPEPPSVETERFRVGSLQEFETEYLLRVGSRPEDVDLWRVANALGVDPV